MMRRRSGMVAGCSLIALGVLFTIASVSWANAHGSGTIFIASGPIGVGLLLLLRAAVLPPDREPHELFDPQRIRRPEDLRPQIAGMRCVSCEGRIVMALEGDLCPTCEKPMHKSCSGTHAKSHAGLDAPFR